MSVVAKQLGGSRCHLVLFGREVGLGAGDIVLDGGPGSPLKAAQPPTLQPMSIVTKRSPISATVEHLFSLCMHRSGGISIYGPISDTFEQHRFKRIEILAIWQYFWQFLATLSYTDRSYCQNFKN